MDAPHHTKVRRLITAAFTPLAVEKMRSWIEAVVERHLARIGDNAEIDRVTDFASAVAAEVSATLVHAPLADLETLLARGHELLAAVGVSLTPDGLEKAEAVACLYYQNWEDVLNSLRRQKLPPDDIVTLLLAAEGQEDGLTHGDVVTLSFGFMLASYHTMKVALTNAMEALLRHPDQKHALLHSRGWRAPPSMRVCVTRDLCISGLATQAAQLPSAALTLKRDKGCFSACRPRTATGGASRTRIALSSVVRLSATWDLAPAPIFASARRSRGSKARSCCNGSSSVSPTCALRKFPPFPAET
jgi:cytochrome P450